MTREEQIKEAARQRANQYSHPVDWSDTYYGFIDGAKWADQHHKCLGEPKVYAITHRAFEFDDIGYSNLEPIRFFSTKEKRDKAFAELVSDRIEWFEKCKADNLKYYNKERVEEGYTIEVNDGSTLELYMGKWCYEWGKTEFEIDD